MTQLASKQTLQVSGHLFYKEKAPYFMLGDTAWTLFQRLTLDEATVYFKNRIEKGFNTIFATLINFQQMGDALDFLEMTNQPVEAFLTKPFKPFWDHAKAVIQLAQSMGLTMAVLPVWGDVVKQGYLNTDNVDLYVDFLIDTFKACEQIVWVVGGDCRGDDGFLVWNQLGESLKTKDPNSLVSYHPFGRTSSIYWFQDAAWLDFHLFQSGHRRGDQKQLNAWDDKGQSEPWYGEANYRYVLDAYDLQPTRPIMDGEPSYEHIPQGLHDPLEPYWQDHHIRRYAYWAVFAGAAGHIYGHNSIMQFFGAGGPCAFGAIKTWQEAMHDTGGSQMGFLKDLVLEADLQACKPLTETIVVQSLKKDPSDCVGYVTAFGHSGWIMVYVYEASDVTLNIKSFIKETRQYNQYWMDPISGRRSFVGTLALGNKDTETFIVPQKTNHFNDWVLMLMEQGISPVLE